MDIVVTVPKNFTHPAAPGKRGLQAWIAEGDAAGDPDSGAKWWFTTWGTIPEISNGERVYVVCEGRIRGYSPLVEIMRTGGLAMQKNKPGPIAFVRGGVAVAVTIPEAVQGFRGWRYRWWERAQEIPFPNWREV